jgi:NIPSNAP
LDERGTVATMMARIQVKYGMGQQFYEVMGNLIPFLERDGWKLIGAYQTRVGRLWEVWDLWEIPDANSIETTLAAASKDPEFARWAAKLPECVEEEELRLLQKVPYSPA